MAAPVDSRPILKPRFQRFDARLDQCKAAIRINIEFGMLTHVKTNHLASANLHKIDSPVGVLLGCIPRRCGTPCPIATLRAVGVMRTTRAWMDDLATR